VAKLYLQEISNLVFPISDTELNIRKLYHRFVYQRLLSPQLQI